MVKFRNGVMQLCQGDFVYCPICGTQTREGKKFRVKSRIIGMDILPHTAPFLTMPLSFDPEESTIRFATDRERVGWNGYGARIIFLCEDGHKWERVLVNHGDEAISFAEAVLDHSEQEVELDRMAEEDDDEEESE